MTPKERVKDVAAQFAQIARRTAKQSEHITEMAEMLDDDGAAAVMTQLEAMGFIGPDGKIACFSDALRDGLGLN